MGRGDKEGNDGRDGISNNRNSQQVKWSKLLHEDLEELLK
jgi:hypothetical protein